MSQLFSLRSLASFGMCIAIAVPSIAQPSSLSLSNFSYCQIPNQSGFSLQQFTLATWFRPTGPGENGGGTLISKSGLPLQGILLGSWWLGWGGATGRVSGMVVHQIGQSGRFITSTSTVGINQWAHAALTFDGSTIRLYVNGVLESTEPFNFPSVYVGPEPVKIGSFNDGTGYTFNHFEGNLDEVAIWNRPLSADEVARLASCTPASETNGLVVYLPFTDSSLADASGNNRNAGAVGSPTFGANAPAAITCCDDIDFNNNGVFPEDQDVIDFFNVLAGADCPACNDIDFNNNSVFPEDQDVIDFFNVLAGGTC
ncbi:MAG TPA: LamG domain-containing protein [Phycisphaerales bacterium]|nr:LamG domain-containing protein [Phycisphaerales bacterium]